MLQIGIDGHITVEMVDEVFTDALDRARNHQDFRRVRREVKRLAPTLALWEHLTADDKRNAIEQAEYRIQVAIRNAIKNSIIDIIVEHML